MIAALIVFGGPVVALAFVLALASVWSRVERRVAYWWENRRWEHDQRRLALRMAAQPWAEQPARLPSFSECEQLWALPARNPHGRRAA